MKPFFRSWSSIKKMMVAVLIISAPGSGCHKSNSGGQTTPTAETTTITYTSDATDFPNPERGFYRHVETSAASFVPLNLAILKGYRSEQSISGATYKVLSSLVFRNYVLTGFNNAPLTTDLLNKIAADFDIARQAGIKLIVRFNYTVTPVAGSCPESFACPPYGDAPKSVVLNHIAQLKPVLTANSDVIACMQLGFIGIWGENYYTDYFGDASSNASQGKLLDNNWQDRIEVLQALLNALPKDRMVQVRLPQFKQRYVYGVNAGTTSAALTDAEGFTETDKARIGFHNDCFLSGTDDYGTFSDYGNSSTPRTGDNTTVTALRTYQQQDSKYVVAGGETCDDTYSPQNDCETAGRAETEMGAMHYSYLNSGYNTAVNNDWQTGGCMNSIKIKLGYRFVLKDGTFTNKAKAGGAIKVVINLDNIGYTSPYNARPVQLLLRNKTTGDIKKFDFTTDIRKWFKGSVKLDQSFTLPADIATGLYELLLFMPDNYASIATRSEYAIRLGNVNVWEDATGYNKLNHTLTVE